MMRVHPDAISMTIGVGYARALLVGLVLSYAVGTARAGEARPALYVYVHTDAKSAALEKGLQDKLPGLTVTVFGRFRDFEEAMSTRKPDGVVALQPLLSSLSVPVALQGLRGNSDWEPYVLLSTGPLDGSLSSKVVGVVDLLGRDGTQEFVARLLKTSDIKIKRVTKMEDLLPLLQFAAVDGVLVPAAGVKAITERSRLSLRVRELPEARVGLLAVGVLNAKTRELFVKQVQTLDAETNRTLGVEKWRAR
jgi:hypothetical protein